MKYKPKSAEGQILVEFKSEVNRDFARTFGKQIGIRLAKEDYEHGDAFIYQTEPGEERQAIKEFKRYRKFVAWADLRDLRLEARWNELEEIIAALENLRDNADTLGDKDYQSQREALARRLAKKEKKEDKQV